MSNQNYTNGASDGEKYIDTLDQDDPEYQRQLIRPIVVKEDVRQMEDRKRVKLVLHSRAFRDELEELVNEQLNPALGGGQTGGKGGSVSAQLLSDLILPQARSSLLKQGVGPCIPVADVHELDLLDFDKGERQFRCKLASLYRLVDLFGWSHGIQSYITGRINQDFEHFLIAPYGMLHHEVTASSLVKVDMRGDVLDPGSTNLGVSKTGFSLHSAIYASRPNIKCVVHLRCTPAVSISALNAGLMPLCPEAMAVGDVSYFEYNGGFLDLEQRDKLRRVIGPINKIFILRNFGIIVGGETIEEVFYLVRNVMIGVNTQLRLISSDLSKVTLPSENEKRMAFEAANESPAGVDGKKWRRGEMEFESLIKHLDDYGYRTGYQYREQQERTTEKLGRSHSEVVIPPASSSYVYAFTEDSNHRVASPVKGSGSNAQSSKPKKGHKSDWMTHPDKENIDDSDVVDNIKTTGKFVPDETSTPIKLQENSAGGHKKEQTQQTRIENTRPEEQQVQQAKQQSTPQTTVSNAEDVLHDRESSPERSQQSSGGRDTPGSATAKDKKKKIWSFSSKKEKH